MLAEQIRKLGYRQVGWINGRPNLQEPDADWDEIERLAANPGEFVAPFAPEEHSASRPAPVSKAKKQKPPAFRSTKK